jgi:hypothetical protein
MMVMIMMMRNFINRLKKSLKNNALKNCFSYEINKKAIATSTLGYVILGIIALFIVVLVIYGLASGSLTAVDKIFGG